MSVVGLVVTPRYRTDLRRWRVVTVRGVWIRKKLLGPWMREGPLYQLPSEYQCDRTFVIAAGKMECIQQTNVELWEGARLDKTHCFIEIPECIRCPRAWRNNHHASRMVKTIEGLRLVLDAPVNSTGWPLLQGEGGR